MSDGNDRNNVNGSNEHMSKYDEARELINTHMSKERVDLYGLIIISYMVTLVITLISITLDIVIMQFLGLFLFLVLGSVINEFLWTSIISAVDNAEQSKLKRTQDFDEGLGVVDEKFIEALNKIDPQELL